jgi:hypothetical protein
MVSSPVQRIPTTALAVLYCWLSLFLGTAVRAEVTAPAALDQGESSLLLNLLLDPSELDTLKDALRARDYARTESLLGAALNKNPTLKPLLAFLGRVLFLEGKYNRSITELKEAEKHGELGEGERATLSMADVVLRRYGEAQTEVTDSH